METESQVGIQEDLYLQAMETAGPRPRVSTKCHAHGIELRTMAGFVSGFHAQTLTALTQLSVVPRMQEDAARGFSWLWPPERSLGPPKQSLR